jgi:hypothetical protein
MWRAEVPLEAIAEAQRIRLGTAKSRAHTLQKEGKITPHLRGRRILARQGGSPVPAPPAPRVPPVPPAPPAPQVAPAPPASPAMTFVAVPEVQEILSVLKDLQARVVSLEQARVSPAPPAVPAPPAPARQEIQQWTVRLSKALIEHIKAVAYERRLNPSELVEQWLREKQPSPAQPLLWCGVNSTLFGKHQLDRFPEPHCA